ncbi:MAG: DUF4124 domain-containing protein [Brachymonas sp.]|nr:DUF4124 domain-containing protein [Brachymonas sp.]
MNQVSAMKKHLLAFAALPCILLARPAAAQIYTCVDAQGRRHTSDRPIAACLDREQRQLSKNGVVQRIIPPSYTAEEKAAIAARAQQEEEQRQQERAKAKSMSALLQRYPTQAAHQAARKAEMGPIMARISESQERIEQIKLERAKLDEEMAFYRKTPDKMPAKLRMQIQASRDSEQAANRYIAKLREELLLLDKRYDNERAMLEPMWKK